MLILGEICDFLHKRISSPLRDLFSEAFYRILEISNHENIFIMQRNNNHYIVLFRTYISENFMQRTI